MTGTCINWLQLDGVTYSIVQAHTKNSISKRWGQVLKVMKLNNSERQLY